MRHFVLLALLLLPLATLADSPLRDHPSSYLALHADDPLDWQLWDSALFEQAQEENKLIFVSSGYYACHWCHVMQRESYQDEGVAALLNEHFIAIKLDRELRPDLDTYLFDFTQRTHGIAGWPLNVFLTPEGRPLLGFVYQPRDEFLATIEGLQQRWQADSAALSQLAREAARPEQDDPAPSGPAGRDALREDLVTALAQALQQQGDFLSGGLGSGSKFPRVALFELLLAHYPEHPDLGDLLVLTLEQMQALGLRDHLGGGFFRYTVDPDWREPHFEKMLYDNALLARLYLRAARQYDDPGYRELGLQTLDFMLRGMWHPQGGFIGSLSAVDGADVEGGYYLWDMGSLQVLLSEDQLALLAPAWGTHASAIWEAGYLPIALHDQASLAAQLGWEEAEVVQQLQTIRQTLMRERRQRSMPYDDKRLAGWNGLALSALAQAHDAHPRYRLAGSAVRDYLHRLWDGERLWMMRDNQDRRQQQAGLEDYAFVASGLYHWHQATGDEASKTLATTLLKQAAQRFHDDGGWLLGGEDSALLGQRYPLLPAGALPSPAIELLRLQRQLELNVLPEAQLLWNAPQQLLSTPLDYPGYLSLMLEFAD